MYSIPAVNKVLQLTRQILHSHVSYNVGVAVTTVTTVTTVCQVLVSMASLLCRQLTPMRVSMATLRKPSPAPEAGV